MMFYLIMLMFSIDCSTACLCAGLMIIYSLVTKPGCCLSVCVDEFPCDTLSVHTV